MPTSDSDTPLRQALLPLVLIGLAAIGFATAGWIRFRFGKITFDQLVLHLPLGNQEATQASLVWEGLAVCLLVPLALVYGGYRLWQRRATPAAIPRRARWRRAAPPLAAATALGVLLTVAGVPQYAIAELDPHTVAPYYVTPSVTGLTTDTGKPLNLITIYLESMEETYADPALFGSDLLSELDTATADWQRIDSFDQYPGGGWTMAGIVSTQCAIPLKSRLLVAGVNPNDFGESVDSYLPGTTCLGDLLAEQGYRTTWLGGAHTTFAGKSTFLREHGVQTVLGREHWEAQGASPADISIWGMSDLRLFEKAREQLAELRSQSQPYYLGLLTLDTHEPAGVFPSCSTDDEVAMATAIRCSTRALAGFLNDLAAEGVLEDTVVVVMGDHLKATAEGGDFATVLDQTPQRHVVFRVSSPEPVTFGRQQADQLSVLPTLLELVGFQVPQGRAGLGVSMLAGHSVSGTALELPDSEYESVILSRSSDFYRARWGVDG